MSLHGAELAHCQLVPVHIATDTCPAILTVTFRAAPRRAWSVMDPKLCHRPGRGAHWRTLPGTVMPSAVGSVGDPNLSPSESRTVRRGPPFSGPTVYERSAGSNRMDHSRLWTCAMYWADRMSDVRARAAARSPPCSSTWPRENQPHTEAIVTNPRTTISSRIVNPCSVWPILCPTRLRIRRGISSSVPRVRQPERAQD